MNETFSPERPSRWRAILYVLLIFIGGTVFGSALTIVVGRKMIERPREPAALNIAAMRRLNERLDLSPEQRARIEPVLQEMAGRMREVRVASRRQWISIIQDTREKVRAELTPEQQAVFDKIATRARGNLGRLLGAPPETPPRRNPPEP